MVHALGLFSSSSPLERVIVPNKPTVVVVAVGLGGVGDATAAAACTRGVCLPSFFAALPPSPFAVCGFALKKEALHSLTHSPSLLFPNSLSGTESDDIRGPEYGRWTPRKGSGSLLLGSLFSIFDPLRSVSMPSRRPVSRVFRCAFNVVVKCLGYGRAGKGGREREN